MASVEETAVALGNPASEEFRRAVGVLGRVGLTQYEARAYIALVARGLGDAAGLATAAGLPRTSAYKVLESLASKGYAQPTGGKPALFRPTPPLEVAETLKAAIQEVFEQLAELHRVVADHGEPQLVYLISDREKVLAKIGDLLDQSARTFILTTPQVVELRDALGKKFQSAVKRGVHVTIVTAALQKLPDGVRARRTGEPARDRGPRRRRARPPRRPRAGRLRLHRQPDPHRPPAPVPRRRARQGRHAAAGVSRGAPRPGEPPCVVRRPNGSGTDSARLPAARSRTRCRPATSASAPC